MVRARHAQFASPFWGLPHFWRGKGGTPLPGLPFFFFFKNLRRVSILGGCGLKLKWLMGFEGWSDGRADEDSCLALRFACSCRFLGLALKMRRFDLSCEWRNFAFFDPVSRGFAVDGLMLCILCTLFKLVFLWTYIE